MAEQAPEFIDSKQIFSGRIFDVTVDTVREGDRTYVREVVHHRGSAVMVPAFDDGTIAMVRQYRHPAVKYLLELPAGTLDDKERPEEGAARELEEELGVVAGKLEKLCEFFVSPGFCEEKMWLYLATDLKETKQRLEDDELIEGDLDFFAVRQVEKIDPLFQRHDPAIEQRVGAHFLAAEVVDDQRATVALELQRGFADARRAIERHLQAVHG